MCLFVLFLALLFIVGVSLIIEDRDISAPSFLNASIWALVVLVATLNVFNWEYDISLFTFGIIFLSCILFTAGVKISKLFVRNNRSYNINVSSSSFNKKYYKKFLIIFSIIGYILLILEIREKSSILSSLGQSFYSSNFLFSLRHKEALGFQGKVNVLLSVAFDIYEGLSFVLISITARNIIGRDYKIKSLTFMIFLVSQVPVLGYEFLSTGRTGFLRYFTVILVSTLCYLRKTDLSRNKVLKKGFKYIIKTFIIVILVFLFAGIFTGKTSINSIRNTLSLYIASAILAFDKAVVMSDYHIHSEGPLRSLFGVRYILSKFGLCFRPGSRADQFLAISDNLTTNIYTAFYDYYLDFGFFGTLVIYFLFGIVCGYIYNRTKTKKNEFWIAFYAYYSYLLVRQITEAFFLKMSFTEVHLVPIFSIVLGYYLITKKVFACGV